MRPTSHQRGSGWETWQDRTLPPGQFAVDYMNNSATAIPVFTYYELLQSTPSTGQGESDRDYNNLNNAATMNAYYANFKLLMQKSGAYGGQVVIHGWRTVLPLTAVDAVRALEPYCDEFLYTHVDTEGLMGGTNIDAIRAVRDATTRRVTAAGGITTQKEIDDLHALGVDSVVGMAIYTGTLNLEP